MTAKHFARLGLGLVSLASAASVAAGTLTPIAPYVGAGVTSTFLSGINNAGWTSGSVRYADYSERGFIRDPAGVYTVFTSTPTATFTEGRGINNSNTVTGWTTGNVGFKRTVDGTISLLSHPVDRGPQSGIPLAGIAQGINDYGTIVGNYNVVIPPSVPGGRARTVPHGYILSANGFTEIAEPNALVSVKARGITNDGTVVGFTGYGTGFIRSGTIFTEFTHPGDLSDGVHTTGFVAINNRKEILGFYFDSATSSSKTFVFDPVARSFTDIVVPGATYVQNFGLNDSGQYVTSSDVGQFIYTPGGPTAPDGSSVFMPVAGGTLPAGQSQFAITVKPGTTYYIDPAFAHGFEYRAGTGPLFASVTAPTGIGTGHFSLYLWNGTSYVYSRSIDGGTAFTFATAVDRFELGGIPDSAAVDFAHPTSFVTGLTFAGAGTFNGFQNALGAVPEPASWWLVIAGFGLVGTVARRRGALAQA